MQLVNSSLSSLPIYLILVGPVVVYPALLLPLGSLYAVLIASGLLVDAAVPAPFGLFTLVFILSGTAIFQTRERLSSEHNQHPILFAQLTNALCILLLALFMARSRATEVSYWVESFLYLFASQVVLLFVAPWFYSLQRIFVRPQAIEDL